MEHEELLAVRHELALVRAANARLNRTIEDLLYNLDGENMPTVDARIRALEERFTTADPDGEGESTNS